uniref:prephenate dehydrogenase n=1 Tax=Orrella sp. TaxID=1921583 RepID=UPI004048D4BF
MTPEQTGFRIGTLAIVGVGLIGGSFALALKKAGVVNEVIGVGRRPTTLEHAQALGVIDRVATFEEAAGCADLIMISAPVGSFEAIFEALAPNLNPRARITDGGSTKGNVVAAARLALGAKVAQFVPAHPVAGSHESGPQAARPDLYVGRQVVICPLAQNQPSDVSYVREAWLACGADLKTLDAIVHDEVLASISHLPHWLASLYVAHVAKQPNAATCLAMAGAGFGDFSRIAQGSEEMWRDIFTANREAMLRQISDLQDLLNQAELALRANDTAWIESMLTQSAQVRRQWGKGVFRGEQGHDPT